MRIVLGQFPERSLLLMRCDHLPCWRRMLLEEFLLGDLWLWSVSVIITGILFRLIKENVAEKLRLLFRSPLPALLCNFH